MRFASNGTNLGHFTIRFQYILGYARQLNLMLFLSIIVGYMFYLDKRFYKLKTQEKRVVFGNINKC